MRTSIIQQNKECFICGKRSCIEVHHIFGAFRRKKSEQYGLLLYLCKEHHTGTNGCHGKKGSILQNQFHKIGQNSYIKTYNKTVEDFMEVFGKNYL